MFQNSEYVVKLGFTARNDGRNKDNDELLLTTRVYNPWRP